jgi:dienelactone hydrolase
MIAPDAAGRPGAGTGNARMSHRRLQSAHERRARAHSAGRISPSVLATLATLAALSALAGPGGQARAADGATRPLPTAVTASTVAFDSADGRTRLIGYLFRPAGKGPFPAIVLMHGRAGLYSSLPGSTVSLESLSVRHRYWARFLANEGYVALLVDGFAPRGYPAGFGRGTYASRPPEVSEQTVRPLDADGAAAYLKARDDVIAERIGLLGWSNGAMSAIARITRPAAPGDPFRAAIALYPGCVIPEREGARPTVPLLLLVAGEDDEVSPQRCANWAGAVAPSAPGFVWQRYEGAAHNFDGLALGTRASAADRLAAAAAETRARAFLAHHLGPVRPE